MDFKVERLINQFPFLDRIIPAETVGSPTHVDVKVIRADSSHMYWTTDVIDGVGQTIGRGNGKNHVGTRSENIYLIDGVSSWRVREDSGALIDILQNGYSDPDRWDAVVFASCEHWHEAPSEAEEANYLLLGDFVENELTIRVLQAPKAGFGALIANTDLLSNVSLNMPTMLDFMHKGDKRFERLNEALGHLANEFESKVYDQGLREIVSASEVKGMSGRYGGVNLMTWVMCGRVMMTFHGLNGRQITLIGVEEGKLRAGVQSIDATFDEAKEIISTVIRVWETTSPAKRPSLHHDDDQVNLF